MARTTGKTGSGPGMRLGQEVLFLARDASPAYFVQQPRTHTHFFRPRFHRQ